MHLAWVYLGLPAYRAGGLFPLLCDYLFFFHFCIFFFVVFCILHISFFVIIFGLFLCFGVLCSVLLLCIPWCSCLAQLLFPVYSVLCLSFVKMCLCTLLSACFLFFPLFIFFNIFCVLWFFMLCTFPFFVQFLVYSFVLCMLLVHTCTLVVA